MENKNHQDDGGREGKEVRSEGKKEMSLKDLYKEIKSFASAAFELSKKGEMERACEKYEKSLELVNEGKKREDLTEYYKELFEKAEKEIEKHYKRSLEKRKIKASLISPQQKDTKEEEREGVIQIGTAESEKEKIGETKEEKEKRSFHLTTRKRKISAIFVVFLLLLLVLAVFAIPEERMSVTVPPKHIGDKAVYGVEGFLSANSKTGVTTSYGVLNGVNINFRGTLTWDVNTTKKVKDGFDKERWSLEEYLYQDLNIDGTIDLGLLNPNLQNGKLVTHQTEYTDLTTKKTIQYKISNNFRITIPTSEPPTFSKEIYSVDKGTFFTPFLRSYSPIGFLNTDITRSFLPERIKEGDSNKSEAYNLKWKAEGTKKIGGYESLCIKLSEIQKSEWYHITFNYWLSSDCPFPTSVEVKGWLNTDKLDGDLFSQILKAFSGSTKLEFKYTASIRSFERGEEEVPYGIYPAGDHERDKHEKAVFVNWLPEGKMRVPAIFGEEEENKTTAFKKDFQPLDAYEFALNNSEGLNDYLTKHKSAYAVEGSYTLDKKEGATWEFIFAYFDLNLLNPKVKAYAIKIALVENGTNTSFRIVSQGETEISKPDRTNTEMKNVLSFVSAEEIFKENEETKDFAFKKLGEQFVIDFNKTVFKWEMNTVGGAAGLLNQVFPENFNVPSLVGYHLRVNLSTSLEERNYSDAMLDGETGMRIYILHHRDNFM